MAILYGTQSNGETLPVQVNEFGQLVAQGLPGEQGIQGPPGEPGPVGEVEFDTGSFLPVFSSSDPSGAGFIEYDRQTGYWYRFGPLLTVQIYLRTSSVVLTDIRGNLEVSGFPPEARFAVPSAASSYGPFSLGYFYTSAKGLAHGGRLVYISQEPSLGLSGWWDGKFYTAKWADLDSADQGQNLLTATWSGLAADAVRSVPIPLDEVM